MNGYDLRKNGSVTYDYLGEYATDVFSRAAVECINSHNTDNPLFLYLSHLAVHSGNNVFRNIAPNEEIKKFKYIKDFNRRQYAAAVSILDKGVGQVITALRNRDMLENSIIVWISDNGAPVKGLLTNHGSNYPFRGVRKRTSFIKKKQY